MLKLVFCCMIARCYMGGTSGMFSRNIRRNSGFFGGAGGAVCESEFPCHLQFWHLFKYPFVPHFFSCFIYLFSSLT